MNRQRVATGVNSYEKELGNSVVEILQTRVTQNKPAIWLDVCCGEGLALVELAQRFTDLGTAASVLLIGLDLVDFYSDEARKHPCIETITANVESWQPGDLDGQVDLITCVHGLHYMGNKLAVIEKLSGLLRDSGQFHGNFDIDSMVDQDGATLSKRLTAAFDRPSVVYHHRRRTLSVTGKFRLGLDLVYLGAKDDCGPNYTGQAAVQSWYQQSP